MKYIVLFIVISLFSFGCKAETPIEDVAMETPTEDVVMETPTEDVVMETPTEDIISEERIKEIEDAKKDLIYENFPFSALGWTRKQIIEEYGGPDRINEQYVVGEHIHYENVVFSLENEERTCNAIVIHEGHEGDVLGIFMGTKEIEERLGDADKESMSPIGTFSKTYFFDNEKVRVIFITYEEEGPVMQIYVIWDFLSK